MEAIIRTENKTLFEALLQFLESLNIHVETKTPSQKVFTKERKKESTDFQKLLLKGPVMSKDDYEYFKEKKNEFNKWK